MPLEDLQPLGRWSYYAGSAATVTLASGEALIALWAHATTAASLVITPKGANQTGTAGPTITIPANTVLGPITFVGQMTGGTILVFTLEPTRIGCRSTRWCLAAPRC